MLVRPRSRRLARSGVDPAAERPFVRCLNVLMAGQDRSAAATVDPRPVAITGERAARHGRAPDSWEYVMPWGRATEERHRMLAAGHAIRIHLPVVAGRA